MALRPVTSIIGLCAGVGGLELGIMLGEHIRGRDVRGVCYVEREAAAAAALVASMDAGWLHPAPVWSDLASFDGGRWRGRVHCIASGDPCQGNSVAGKQLGADDERFLIGDVLRIVDAVRPDRVFRENVTGNAGQQLEALVGPLEAMGYRVAAGIFSSGRTGNSHGRERLVVMADRADGSGRLHSGSWRSVEGAADAGRGGAGLDDTERPERRAIGDPCHPARQHARTRGRIEGSTRAGASGALLAPADVSGSSQWAFAEIGRRIVGIERQAAGADSLQFPPASFLALPTADGGTFSTDGRNSPPPSTKRKLNPFFVEALMRWPSGLSGFERAETAWTRWWALMPGYVSALCSPGNDPAVPVQGRLL